MIFPILASDLNDYLNVFIAIGTLGGIIGAGLWKLRTLLRSDMEDITKKHVGPVATAQEKTNETLIQHSTAINDHEKRLQVHEGEIRYIRGKEDARAELAQGLSGVGGIAQALTHPEEHDGKS